MKSTVIVVLLALLVWFGASVVRLENARYATSLGMCDQYQGSKLYQRQRCLDGTQTRTSWVYNLLYGLRAL